jgi:dipeptidyl aminopeptidase/acylaminoacyl peptidase
MKRTSFLILILLLLAASGPGSVRAQDAVFPLPAPLYILTSEYQLLHVNPQTGEQTMVSPEEQRVADFDIAPDGEWYAYRTWENNAVIVSEIGTGSGYVVEFSDSPPREGSPARTIAWSPDVSALAYVVQDGVRIAELGAGDYGVPLFSMVQGPWVEMYWADNETLIASDEGGNSWRVSGTYGQWTVEAVSGVAMREQPPIPAYLTAEGVVLGAGTVIPRTAGTLAFEWGPPPLPVVAGLVMHTDLYFQAADANGVAQVWQLPRSGGPPRPLTTGNVSITSYAIAPDQSQVAYIVEEELIVADLDGARQRLVATLQPGRFPSSVAWSPDGTRLAFHDARGMWTVPADGFRPQHMLVASHPPSENQADAANVKVYFDPRWSPDGTRLLVRIGFWEGSILGVIDAASGAVTELPRVVGSAGDWTGDGRVIAWSSSWGMPRRGCSCSTRLRRTLSRCSCSKAARRSWTWHGVRRGLAGAGRFDGGDGASVCARARRGDSRRAVSAGGGEYGGRFCICAAAQRTGTGRRDSSGRAGQHGV